MHQVSKLQYVRRPSVYAGHAGLVRLSKDSPRVEHRLRLHCIDCTVKQSCLDRFIDRYTAAVPEQARCFGTLFGFCIGTPWC